MTDYIVKLNPKARIEYLEAFLWYEKQLAGLGSRFETAVQKKIDAIALNPLFYQVKEFNCRQSKIADFPYVIVYRLFHEQGTLVILSIIHTKKNPAKKLKGLY